MKVLLAGLVALLVTGGLPSITEVPIQYGKQLPSTVSARARADCDSVPMTLIYGPGDTAQFLLITGQHSACTAWAIREPSGQGLQ